ncbi:hypothetical protein H5410_024624 [Solanum commersonii]|uniref:NmrA-like domain-containing protein n=1 Tax=Solanum commersonii TaxID=4109 RepID=A0A9J5ZML1_SOLCO|nr:hypothetical protein H5410_024624 [Solanum commersonii]
MADKSKVLIIGDTGYIGKFVVEASAKSGYPTFALVRETTISDPVKGKIVENFKNLVATIINGDLYDHESLLKAIKQVDLVISTVVKIIDAIKEAGNIKVNYFLFFKTGLNSRPLVKDGGILFICMQHGTEGIMEYGDLDYKIPYTFVLCNCFAGYFLATLVQPGATAPPRDKVIITRDGNVKAVFNEEHDIGTYTIKAVDDPRTLNKSLYIRPPKNTLSFNELVAIWEKLIGKTLEKIYVPVEQLLKDIQTSPMPINFMLALNHSTFVKGDQTNFEIEPSFGVEASELYPDVKYTTVEEYLGHFV